MKEEHMGFRNSIVLGAALLAAAFVAAGCGNNGNDGERREVEQTIQAWVQSAAAGDNDAVLARLTDKGLAELAFFAMPAHLEEVKAGMAEHVASSELKQIKKTRVSGKKATVQAELEMEGSARTDEIRLVKQGTDWKIDGYEYFAVSQKVPSGYTTVKVDMQDFAFAFDSSKVKPGKIAFDVKNSGVQPHELVFFRVDESLDLDAMLESEEEPEGVEYLGFIAFRGGHQATLVINEPLTPGRYVMLCFLPDFDDEEGTPHFALGMVADFNVN
jgi:hypothetical protein